MTALAKATSIKRGFKIASHPHRFDVILLAIPAAGARIVIWAIWPTLLCLMGIGPVIAVKHFSEIAPRAASAATFNASAIIAARSIQQDTLQQTDRLPSFSANAEAHPNQRSVNANGLREINSTLQPRHYRP
jgi:hypothetical protein